MLTPTVFTWQHIVAYSLIALVQWRRYAGALAWSGGKIDGVYRPDWGPGFWCGLAGAIIWPLVAIVILCTNLSDRYHWPEFLLTKTEREALAHNRRVEHEKRAKELEMPVS